MFLLGKRIRGLSIDSPLSKEAITLESEELEQLVLELKAGDVTVIESIIRAHLRQTIHIVSQYGVNAKHMVPDLIGIAILSIVESCARVKEGALVDNNITGYILTRVHSKVSQAISRDRKYEKIELPIIHSKHDSLSELKEVLDQSIKDHTERLVIELRAKNYNDREISEIIHINKNEVNKLRHQVEERFNAIMEQLDD